MPPCPWGEWTPLNIDKQTNPWTVGVGLHLGKFLEEMNLVKSSNSQRPSLAVPSLSSDLDSQLSSCPAPKEDASQSAEQLWSLFQSLPLPEHSVHLGWRSPTQAARQVSGICKHVILGGHLGLCVAETTPWPFVSPGGQPLPQSPADQGRADWETCSWLGQSSWNQACSHPGKTWFLETMWLAYMQADLSSNGCFTLTSLCIGSLSVKWVNSVCLINTFWGLQNNVCEVYGHVSGTA